MDIALENSEREESDDSLEPEVSDSIHSKKKEKAQKQLDNEENTIFVGNLPNKTTEGELKKLFRGFGPILHARLRCAIRKDLKLPKKVAVIKKEFHEDSNHINAFIKFKTFESCKAALKMNGKLYGEHHLRVTLAKDGKTSDTKKCIFLGNLAFKTQDDAIWEAFKDCGTVESVRVIRDNETGIGKGFGYVNFKSADSVELALNLNGISILGRNIRVSRAVNDVKKVSKSVKKEMNQKLLKPKRKHNEQEKTTKESKPFPKVRGKHEFQGQKTKPSVKRKIKKKKKFDKKKEQIKQIAEEMVKKN